MVSPRGIHLAPLPALVLEVARAAVAVSQLSRCSPVVDLSAPVCLQP